MALTFDGLEVHINPWINRNTVLKTDNDEIVLHPYTAGCLMLETSAHDYSSVFKNLGVTDQAVDACVDSAIRLLNNRIDNQY